MRRRQTGRRRRSRPKRNLMANLALKLPGKFPQGLLREALRRRSSIYLISLSLVVLAFVLRALLAPTLGDQALYLFLVPPVLVAGVAGGWWPGLLATAASLVLHLYVTGEFSNLARPNSPFFATEL